MASYRDEAANDAGSARRGRAAGQDRWFQVQSVRGQQVLGFRYIPPGKLRRVGSRSARRGTPEVVRAESLRQLPTRRRGVVRVLGHRADLRDPPWGMYEYVSRHGCQNSDSAI